MKKKMNELSKKKPPVGQNDEEEVIKLTVTVQLLQSNLNLEISIPSEIPFNIFLDGIKQQIFAQRMSDIYEERIECQLQNGMSIPQNETRSLKMLGFQNGCTLYIRIFKKQQCRHCNGQQQGQKIKVQVEYEVPYDPNISMEEQTNRIKNAIHF